jgi:DNA-binding protein YbaB
MYIRCISNDRATIMKRDIKLQVLVTVKELEIYKTYQKDNDIETLSIMIRKAVKELIKKNREEKEWN